jgi:hypothetical protein
VGEHIEYLFLKDQQPIGGMGWSSAPRHIGSRDRYLVSVAERPFFKISNSHLTSFSRLTENIAPKAKFSTVCSLFETDLSLKRLIFSFSLLSVTYKLASNTRLWQKTAPPTLEA